MPNSIKMQAEYGDDVQVIFVECQGTTVPDTEKFILEHKWMGSTAMWTNERPFDAGMDGLPSYALLGVEGQVLEKGHHMASSTKELIEAEIEKAGDGPEDASKDIAKAWKSFSKGKLQKAIADAQKAGEKPEFAEEAQMTIAEFGKRTQARIDSAKWRIDNGYFSAAEDLLDELAKEVKGTDYEADVASQAARLDDPALKPEIEAEEALERITSKLFEEGYDKKGKFQKSLEKFVEKYDGSKAAIRGRSLLAMAPTGH
ncbi:MAG: hypothetical protein H6831_06615 [Planctomycetes bacterium]|nr:hypothetical protein [Planctomycetota bacterium]MCB9904062.1 hypothetical protein [Planctomycetota bacterium]